MVPDTLERFLTGTSPTVVSAITPDLPTVVSLTEHPDMAPLVTLEVPPMVVPERRMSPTEDPDTLVPRTTEVLDSTDQRRTLAPRTRRMASLDSVNPARTLVRRTQPSEVRLGTTVRLTVVPRMAPSDTMDHTTEALRVQTSQDPQLTEGRSTTEEQRAQQLTAVRLTEGRTTVAPLVLPTTEDQRTVVPALLI